MATSGSIKSNSWRYDSGSNYVHVQLDWNTVSQDKVKKTSTISWKLKVGGMPYSTSWYVFYNSKVVINGSVVHSSSYYGKAYNGTVLASGNTTITHNPDGTKSVPISIEAGAYWSGTYNLKGSGTAVLDKIHTTPPVIYDGGVTVSGQNQALLGNSLFGVQNVHTVNIYVSAYGRDGATIRNFNVAFQGNTYNSQSVSAKITKSGSLPVTVTVTDDRGNQATKTIATVISRAYSSPKLQNLSVKRYTHSMEDPMGTTLRAVGYLEITAVKDASGQNINAPHWKIGDDGKTRRSLSISFTKARVPITRSENWTITYGDQFSTISTVVSTPKGEPALVLGKKSVGIGTIPESNAEGLWLNPSRINGYDFIKYISLYTAPGEVSSGDYIGVVKKYWDSKVPTGISIAHIYASTQGVAIIHKYTGGNQGSVLIFGYNNTPMKSYRYNSGSWLQTG